MITGADGKLFSKDNQPKNRKKSTKFLTDLLTKELKTKGEMTVMGLDKETGEPVEIIVTATNKEALVHALLKQAGKGNILAIKEIFDRVEGKVIQGVASTDMEGNNVKSGMTEKEIDERIALLQKAIT